MPNGVAVLPRDTPRAGHVVLPSMVESMPPSLNSFTHRHPCELPLFLHLLPPFGALVVFSLLCSAFHVSLTLSMGQRPPFPVEKITSVVLFKIMSFLYRLFSPLPWAMTAVLVEKLCVLLTCSTSQSLSRLLHLALGNDHPLVCEAAWLGMAHLLNDEY